MAGSGRATARVIGGADADRHIVGTAASTPTPSPSASSTPSPSGEPTWSEDRGTQWDEFFSDWLEPLGSPLTVALAIALAWLVVGRVLVQAYPQSHRFLRAGGASARIVVGVLAVVASALLVTLVLPPEASGQGIVVAPSAADAEASRRLAVGLAAFLVGVAGAAAISNGLAGRLRITIDAKAADGKEVPSAARIVALLRKLGADAPQGMEVPVGTDVSVLSDAVTKVAAPDWLSSIVSALSAVLGFTPWKVVIDRTAEGTAVVITRNGRTMDSTVVRTDLLGEGMPTVPADVLIAAFVLATVAEGYAERAGFEGLLGSRNATSIGLVASTQPEIVPTAAGGDDALRVLCAAALLEDNPFTRIALHERLYRDNPNAAVSEGYAQWLFEESARYGVLPDDHKRGELTAQRDEVMAAAVERAGPDRAHPALGVAGEVPSVATRLRLLNACVVVTLNVLTTKARERVATLRLRAAFAELTEFHRSAIQEAPLKPFLDQIAVQIAVLGPEVDEQGDPLQGVVWDAEELDAIDATGLRALGPGAYNTMCTLVRKGSIARALTLYQVVAVDRANREWSLSDPWLGELRRKPAMWKQVAQESDTDLLTVAPFAAHAAALREAGLASASTIAATQPRELAALLSTSRKRAERLVPLARVLVTPERHLGLHLVRIAQVLVAAGATDEKSLRARRAVVAEKLAEVPGLRPQDRDAVSRRGRQWLARPGRRAGRVP